MYRGGVKSRIRARLGRRAKQRKKQLGGLRKAKLPTTNKARKWENEHGLPNGEREGQPGAMMATRKVRRGGSACSVCVCVASELGPYRRVSSTASSATRQLATTSRRGKTEWRRSKRQTVREAAPSLGNQWEGGWPAAATLREHEHKHEHQQHQAAGRPAGCWLVLLAGAAGRCWRWRRRRRLTDWAGLEEGRLEVATRDAVLCLGGIMDGCTTAKRAREWWYKTPLPGEPMLPDQ